MKNAQKPDHVSLSTLLVWLRDGRYVIPNFQREFEWMPWDIRDLVRSIFLDYYIGSLLLWKGKKENFAALSCEPIYAFKGTMRPEYIVLDGQQRLSAMHYAFMAPDAPVPNRSSRAFYYVLIDRFLDQEHDEAFTYEWDSKPQRALRADPAAQYERHIFPCSVIGAGGFALPNWLQGYEAYWSEREAKALEAGDSAASDKARQFAENARQFAEYLSELTQQYQVSYIELDEDLAIEKVCDIFTKLNSKGVRLDVFDLMNALLTPKGLELKKLWHESSARLDFVNSTKMDVYILQVMSILRQAYCSPKYLYYLMPGQEKPIRDPSGVRRKEVLVPTVAAFRRRWDQAVDALDTALDLLRHPQEFGAVSAKYLPYTSILPVFSALQAHIETLPSELRFDAQRKVRLWYWAAVFTNRYSGSVESTSARDIIDVSNWIAGGTSDPRLIDEFKSGFRSLDLRRETNSGSSVYNGIFNLLVLAGARDWWTGTIPRYDDLDDHHIVPASWGAKHLGGSRIHTILNRTPLTGETNRKAIGGKLPNAYLPKMIEHNGETAVHAVLESHFISPAALSILLRDPFSPDDFEEFITARQRTIEDAIENLLIKERLDLPPNLRALDARVEQVELLLRRSLDIELNGDATLLPEHVKQKVEQRLHAAERKNPALSGQRYATLSGRLEYFDLRELQDTIVSKPLWPRFEQQFGTKELLATRFGQLAELRNGLRHSRTVDEITRKDGEAALPWFDQVMGEKLPW